MITAENLTAYVDADPSDGEYITECLDEAKALVNGLLGSAKESVPNPVVDRATLSTAANLYYERQTKLGIIGIGGYDGDAQPVRAAKDPLSKARAILGPWVWGIA